MKLYSKRAVIGFLAILLFSNVTFAHSLDFHLCQGDLQSVALFGKKASCSKMMKMEMSAPRSCCDAKKNFSGLVFKEKSCCDNVHFIQDNVLNKPATDLDQTHAVSIEFFADFELVNFNINQNFAVCSKVEIPPPPILNYRHSQEKLQVFII